MIGSLVELFRSVSKKIIFVRRVYIICGMMAVYSVTVLTYGSILSCF